MDGGTDGRKKSEHQAGKKKGRKEGRMEVRRTDGRKRGTGYPAKLSLDFPEEDIPITKTSHHCSKRPCI